MHIINLVKPSLMVRLQYCLFIYNFDIYLKGVAVKFAQAYKIAQGHKVPQIYFSMRR